MLAPCAAKRQGAPLRNEGAQSNSITIGKNQVLLLPAGNYFTDPNGDAMSFTAATPPPASKGRLVIDAAAGAARFMPKRNSVGSTTFSMFAADATNRTSADAATFRVTVREPRALGCHHMQGGAREGGGR